MNAPLIAWAVVASAICAVMAALEPNLLEEGLIVHLAQRMVDGERLFVDLASFTGPLPFEALALLFRVFGEEIAVARAPIVVVSGLSCGAVFGLARRAGLGEWAHLAAAVVASGPVFFFPLHSIYFYSTLSYHLVLISAYAGLRGRSSDGWAAGAGVLAACVALSKQSVGILIAPGLVLAVFACSTRERRWRAAIVTSLAGISVAAITLVYYAATGALGAMVDSLIFLPLAFEEAFSSKFINLWPLGAFSPELKGQAHFYTPFVYSILRGVVLEAPSFAMTLTTQVLYALPFAALLATAFRRTRGPLEAATWFQTVALLALTSNLFPRTDWGHLVYCAAPAAVQLLLLIPRRPGPISSVSRGLVGLSVCCVMAGAVGVGTGLWRRSEAPDLGPRIALRPVSSQLRDPALGRVIRFLERRAAPGEAIFVARAEPLVYFATGTRNPTPYSGVIPGILDLQQQSILSALADVRFVVMSEIDQPVFTVYRDLLPEVEAFLERHFRLPDEFQGSGYGWIVVLERDEDRGVAAVDLFARRDDARGWIYGVTGEEERVDDELPLLATSHNRRPLPMWIGPYGGGADFEIRVPKAGWFQADVGLAAIHGRQRRHPRRVSFAVSVSTGGAFETIASREVLAKRSGGDRWTPFEVDLAAYQGRRITLRLEVTPHRPLREREIVWWGSPRLIARPQSQLE